VTGRRGRRRRQLLYGLKKQRVLGTERGSTRYHFVEKSPWKRLWTCRMADYYRIIKWHDCWALLSNK